MNTESWHPSFFKGENVKSVFEFELPVDAEEHYNALNGTKYRALLVELTNDLIESIKEGNGSVTAEKYQEVLERIRSLAVEYDVKVFRK
jgi:hypothetical protein